MDANGIDFLLEYYFRGIKIRSVLSIQKQQNWQIITHLLLTAPISLIIALIPQE